MCRIFRQFFLKTPLSCRYQHYGDVIIGAIASQTTSLTIVYSTVYSDEDQRKHQSSASLAYVRGIHRGPVNSPHKWPVMRKMFPFDDVIMIYCSTPWNAIHHHLVLIYTGPKITHHPPWMRRFQTVLRQTYIFSMKFTWLAVILITYFDGMMFFNMADDRNFEDASYSVSELFWTWISNYTHYKVWD